MVERVSVYILEEAGRVSDGRPNISEFKCKDTIGVMFGQCFGFSSRILSMSSLALSVKSCRGPT